MDTKNKHHRYAPEESLPHKLNIFHIGTLFRFFHFSCNDCKLKAKCEPFRHKREICEIAHEARTLLATFTVGHVTSFVSDDFYIKIKKTRKHCKKHEFENIIFQLRSKYAAKTR